MTLRHMPNIISGSRCMVAICLIVLECLNYHISPSVYIFFFTCAFITDAIDGWMARYFSITSDIGALMDLIADKMLFLSLWLYIIKTSYSPIILSSIALLLMREVLITFIRHTTSSSPQTMSVENHGKFKTVYLGCIGIITIWFHHNPFFYIIDSLWAIGVIFSWYSFTRYIMHMFFIKKNQHP